MSTSTFLRPLQSVFHARTPSSREPIAKPSAQAEAPETPCMSVRQNAVGQQSVSPRNGWAQPGSASWA